MEHGATRAGVTVRCEYVGVFTVSSEHAVVFTVSGEHAVVTVYDNGGLRATSGNTADGAVDGADTNRVCSGDR